MAARRPKIVKGKSGYFAKAGNGDYIGPSGQHFDKAQVKMFYTLGGKFPGQSAKEVRAGWRAAAHQRGIQQATARK
jgi:hypothetical protein